MKTLIWIVFAGGIQRPLVASAWHNHCIGFWKEFSFFRVKNIPNPLHNEVGKLLMFSGRLPLKPKPQKWTWMKVNIMNNDRLRARDSMVEEVDRCTYLGTQVTKDMEQHWTSRRGQRLRMQASTGAQAQQDLACRNISTKIKAMLLKKLVLSLSASLRLWNIQNDKEACHLPDQVPQKNRQHQMAAAWCCIVDKDRDRQGWNTWIKRARQAANNCQYWREDVWALVHLLAYCNSNYLISCIYEIKISFWDLFRDQCWDLACDWPQ